MSDLAHTRRHPALPFLATLLLAISTLSAAEDAFPIRPVTKEQSEEYKLDAAFFKKPRWYRTSSSPLRKKFRTSLIARRPISSTW